MSGYLSGLSSSSVTEKDIDLARRPKIAARRSDKIADVLDKKERRGFKCEFIQRLLHTLSVKVPSLACVYLNGTHAGYTPGVETGLLIAVDHRSKRANFTYNLPNSMEAFSPGRFVDESDDLLGQRHVRREASIVLDTETDL